MTYLNAKVKESVLIMCMKKRKQQANNKPNLAIFQKLKAPPPLLQAGRGLKCVIEGEIVKLQCKFVEEPGPPTNDIRLLQYLYNVTL